MKSARMSDSVELELLEAEKRGRILNDVEPRAASVSYDKKADVVIILLKDRQTLHIPRHHLQGLTAATPDQLQTLEILGAGQAIYWPQLDEGFTVPGLAAGCFGSGEWMERLSRQDRDVIVVVSAGKPEALLRNPRIHRQAPIGHTWPQAYEDVRAKGLKPGTPTPRSGIYEQVGPRGGRTGEQANFASGKLLPPTAKPGQTWTLVEPAHHKKDK
ncbi:MAG: DUF2442 domain-containing protein [Armatimonadota bacterium]|nr:DUF2442 domain-containing protein [Armatimonadota bacterium]